MRGQGRCCGPQLPHMPGRRASTRWAGRTGMSGDMAGQEPGAEDAGPPLARIIPLVVRAQPASPAQWPEERPTRWTSGRPAAFPEAPTPLICREREVATLAALLRATDLRLVTLVGPG